MKRFIYEKKDEPRLVLFLVNKTKSSQTLS